MVVALGRINAFYSATSTNFQASDGFKVPVQESKRPFSPRDVLRGLSFDDIASNLELFFRRVVREEVERCVPLFLHSRSTLNQIDSSEVRRWQLHFVNKLPSPIYTGSRIESEDNGPVEIIIVDANSNTKITSGPLSSLKIKILVLDGDFGKDGKEDWTEEEFNDHIVCEREGKGPLVTGELNITLRNGGGCIGDIHFTDNSSWVRSRKFRLGARMMQNVSSEVRIREARSESFVVKDHRGESYKKHHPPSLGDEVWRLERIAKDGKLHTQLASKGIHSVKDFLQLNETNPSSLRRILGGGISNKTWDRIIDHATACLLDDDSLYAYYRAEHRCGLLFNSIYKVVGVTFDGQSYQSPCALTTSQMNFVEKMKQHAYKNINDFVPINDQSIIDPSRHFLCPQVDPLRDSSLALEHSDIPCTHRDQCETRQDFNHSSSTSYTYEHGRQLEFSAANPISPSYTYEDGSQLKVSAANSTQVFSPTLRNSFVIRDASSGLFNEENGWDPSGSSAAALVLSTSQSTAYEVSQVQTSYWLPATTTWGQGNGFLFASSSRDEGECSILPPLPHFGVWCSGTGKPKAGWCKIRAAVKWGILVRHKVAAKRMAQFLYQVSMP